MLQIREPFSIMSVVKSPMGLMVGFMLIVVFLMPKLVENMGNVVFTHLTVFLYHISKLAWSDGDYIGWIYTYGVKWACILQFL